MEFSNRVTLPYPIQTVWNGLNDPDILRACIPGCEGFDAPAPDHFDIVSVLKIGMIKARFEGAVDLTDMDAPNSMRISGAGKGGVAGYASGQAHVWLTATEAGTDLRYEARADVGGKIAQLGSRLINTVANQMADQFFTSFATALAQREEGRAPAPDTDKAQTVAPPPRSISTRADTAPTGRHDWLLPYFIGLGCGALIGIFATMAMG